MPFAELSLAKVYYESHGQGPALVFAHGAGGNALSWWQQTAFFGARYRCVTFDHPGFRHSEWSVPEEHPGADYANVLAELLDHLGIGTAGLVAQSMGGWTCLKFALDHPDRVDALVLAATDGGLYLPNRDTYARQVSELESVRVAWEERRPGSFHPAAGARMLSEQPELHDMYVEIGTQNHGTSRRGWGEIDPAMLGSLDLPVLLVAGAEDIVCAVGRVEALAEALPDSELVIVPESGHSVYFERSGLFNRRVDEFLSRSHPSSPGGRTILQDFANHDQADARGGAVSPTPETSA
ncbi:MAG: alpha/beta hydrolase [Chloroflexi bacterium]|nr:alpha/beta hydrolase [Chloroflexota bacterium]